MIPTETTTEQPLNMETVKAAIAEMLPKKKARRLAEGAIGTTNAQSFFARYKMLGEGNSGVPEISFEPNLTGTFVAEKEVQLESKNPEYGMLILNGQLTINGQTQPAAMRVFPEQYLDMSVSNWKAEVKTYINDYSGKTAIQVIATETKHIPQ